MWTTTLPRPAGGPSANRSREAVSARRRPGLGKVFLACGLSLALFVSLLGTESAAEADITSDWFDGSALDETVWRVVDPVGDSSVGLTGSHLEVAVPGGVSHNLWTNQDWAPRLLQSAPDADFEVEAKFDSAVAQKYQMQGLLATQDAGRFVRADVYHDGSSARVFVARFVDGKATKLYDGVIAGGAPVWLRLARVGDTWTVRYSHDGTQWETAHSFGFALTLAEVGLFAGNHHSTASSVPAFTASVDYFRDVADPLPGSSEETSAPPVISGITVEPTADSAAVSWTTDTSADSHVAYGETTSYELGSVSDSTLVTAHSLTISGLACATTYHFQVSSTNSGGTATSDDATFTTTSCTTTGTDGPVVDVWYGASQRFGHVGNPQQWVTVLGNVSGPAGVESLSYTLDGGPATALTIGPDGRRLADPGDFAIELDHEQLTTGDHAVAITATDVNGATTTATTTIDYTAGQVWPVNHTGSWSGNDLLDVAQPVDGRWVVEGDTVRTVQFDYDRLLAIGDVTWSDYEVTVPITLHTVNPDGDGYEPLSNGPALGLGLRWTGHTGTQQPRSDYWPTGAFAWYRWTDTRERFVLSGANSSKYEPNAYHSSSVNFLEGQTWVYKVRVKTQPDGTHRYEFRMWEQSQAEPSTWTLSIDSPADHPGNGSLLLVAHEVDASFGTVTTTSLE